MRLNDSLAQMEAHALTIPSKSAHGVDISNEAAGD
jgi:hypothetical protein